MNVLRSLYISAYIAGSFTCNVDQLTLSLYSGVNSKQTVRRSIGRLVEAGFVKKLPNNKFRSNCYEMGKLHLRKTTPDIYLTRVNISVFARVLKSISGSAQQVYLTLSEEPQTVKEIVTKTGKCSKTVRDTLRKLEYYSMAFEVKRVWTIGDADINDVANMLGIYEEVADHKDKIKHERFVEKEKRRIYNEYMAQKALPNECENSIIGGKE